MKHIVLGILTILLSSCSIHGKYYLYNATNPDIDIPADINLLPDGLGYIDSCDTLVASFQYKTKRLYRDIHLLCLEYPDSTMLHFSSKGYIDKDILVLGRFDESQSLFVKISPQKKIKPLKKRELRRTNRIVKLMNYQN